MFYVYVLLNEKDRYYIGSTSKNVNERVCEHNSGKSRWTRNKGPWRLVHSENFVGKSETLRRERQLKSFKGGQALKKVLSARDGGNL